MLKDCSSYTVYLAWLQSSTRELQWLEYLKSVFLETPYVTTWSVFQNQVTYAVGVLMLLTDGDEKCVLKLCVCKTPFGKSGHI